MKPQVSSQPRKSPWRCRSRSTYKTCVYFRRSIKVMAELFPYRVVLNEIVLTSSTQETVIAVYMTYRAFAGRGRHDASAGAGSTAVTSGVAYRLSSRVTDEVLQAKETQLIYVFHPGGECCSGQRARVSDAICLFLSISIKSSLIDDRLVYRQLSRLNGGAHHLIVSLRLIRICAGESG